MNRKITYHCLYGILSGLEFKSQLGRRVAWTDPEFQKKKMLDPGVVENNSHVYRGLGIFQT